MQILKTKELIYIAESRLKEKGKKLTHEQVWGGK